MKILRKIIVFFLSIFLSAFIICLFLSFAIKNVVQEEMFTSVIQETVIPEVLEDVDISEENKQIINNILKEEEVKELFNDIVDEVIYVFQSDGNQFSQEKIDSVFNYIVENKTVIEGKTGLMIDTNEITNIMNSQEYKDISTQLTKSINETSSQLDSSTKMVIKSYGFIISNKFKGILLLGIGVVLLLIALVQWSLYNWLSTLGKALTSCGFTMIILYFGMNYVLKTILTNAELNITIDAIKVLYIGIMSIIIGLILIVTRKIIYNLLSKKTASQEIENNVVS